MISRDLGQLAIEFPGLTEEELDILKTAREFDYQGKVFELGRNSRERDLGKAFECKFSAASNYEKLALLLCNAESEKYAKFILNQAACCFDMAGGIANRLGDSELKYKSRSRAAILYCRLNRKKDAFYSYLWASEAKFKLGHKKEGFKLLKKAVDMYKSQKERNPELARAQYEKIEYVAKQAGIQIPEK